MNIQDIRLFSALRSWQRYAYYKTVWMNKEQSTGVKASLGRKRNSAMRLAKQAGYDPNEFFNICERFVKVEVCK